MGRSGATGPPPTGPCLEIGTVEVQIVRLFPGEHAVRRIVWEAGRAFRMYLACRGFRTEKACAYPEGCDALWDRLTEGAVS